MPNISSSLHESSASLSFLKPSFKSSVEPSTTSNIAQRDYEPSKAIDIGYNKSLGHRNNATEESIGGPQLGLNEVVHNPISLPAMKPLIEKKTALIDFDDDGEVDRKTKIKASSKRPKSFSTLQTASLNKLLTTIKAKNFSLHTFEKENMPLITFSASPSPSEAPMLNQMPSPKFDHLCFRNSKKLDPESSTSDLGYDSTSKAAKPAPPLQTDATDFIKAYSSKRPSFTSNWITPSKTSSLLGPPRETALADADVDRFPSLGVPGSVDTDPNEELEEGEIVEKEEEAGEANAEPESSYPKPMFSYADEAPFSENAVFKEFPKESKTSNKMSRSGNAGSWQDRGSVGAPKRHEISIKPRKFEDAMAEVGVRPPPTGTRVLGGELDDECKKMVLNPRRSDRAREAEKRLKWKTVTKEGNEERIYYVLDRN